MNKSKEIQSTIFEIEIPSRNFGKIQQEQSSLDKAIPNEHSLVKPYKSESPVVRFSELTKGLYNLSEKSNEESDLRTNREIE